MSIDNKTMAQHHGVVFTRVPVVEFMLDLVGYHPDEQLHALRLLEPSFGDSSRPRVGYSNRGGQLGGKTPTT